MNRIGLLTALAVAAVGGLVFGFFPALDIAISRFFYERAGGQFPKPDEAVETIRNFYSLIIAGLALPGFLAVALKLILPRRPMVVPGRAAVLLIVTIALGPGLTTNVILKDHWGRARPYAVTQFKGPEKFTAWWDLRGKCEGNCSFIAGEPSGAFWTFAPAAMLVPLPYQPVAYAGALAFGVAVGISRVAYGAHFASDVLFAGVVMFIEIWLVYALLYRWPATRITDAQVEEALRRLTRPFYDALWRRPEKKRPASRKRAGRKTSKRGG
ncbi:MAG: phosphatase PAP2 family protein [Pseudolabrys sp.]|nr:phosphatase PAP2 family protein [Pseudolabrys sp.]MBV9262399.1 phosphatase PAP2 family protein [Pseudolabrys sp.]